MKHITGYVCLLTAVWLTASAYTDTLERELKELRSEKRRITDAANDVGALARAAHIDSCEAHAIALDQMKELISRPFSAGDGIEGTVCRGGKAGDGGKAPVAAGASQERRPRAMRMTRSSWGIMETAPLLLFTGGAPLIKLVRP